MLFIGIFAAIVLTAPGNGEVVPLLSDAQRAYFTDSREVRFARMDNHADRVKLLAMGSMQKPLRLAWEGADGDICRLEIEFADGSNKQSFALTNKTEAYITNLNLDREYHWRITNANGECAEGSFRTESDGPRFLRAGGVGNFRDFGGWRTVDGKRVREDMIFRSAGLRSSSKSESKSLFASKIVMGSRRITDQGIRTLCDDFKIKTDLELRTPQETAGMKSSVLGEEVSFKCISFAAYDFIDDFSRGREPIAKIFKIFSEKANYPILFHCSGGRDRTGTLAFLLNGLLGVPEDDLCRDWEASIFSTDGDDFLSFRIVRLLDYLKKFPGDSLSERIASYLRICGISEEEMESFRSIMLAPAD